MVKGAHSALIVEQKKSRTAWLCWTLWEHSSSVDEDGDICSIVASALRRTSTNDDKGEDFVKTTTPKLGAHTDRNSSEIYRKFLVYEFNEKIFNQICDRHFF